MRLTVTAPFLALLAAGLAAPAAEAAQCGGNFGQWLDAFRQEARAAGVSGRALSALDGLTPNSKVIAADRRQGVFAQSFLEFSDRMVSGYRLKNGAALISRHRALFDRVEQRFGVPAPVITAFWALETDFGGYMGDFETLRSLVTLAHDCRRPELFRPHLLAALRIIDKGDLTPQDMVGAWAGEIGQTQFLARRYLDHAVDFDGDGRKDLMRSVPDVLASTAKVLRADGWRPGEGWDEGSANYEVLRTWNRASVYVKTIATLANKLAA